MAKTNFGTRIIKQKRRKKNLNVFARHFEKMKKKSLKICKKPGGLRLRLKYGPQLVSGKLHGQLEPVASFWRNENF